MGPPSRKYGIGLESGARVRIRVSIRVRIMVH